MNKRMELKHKSPDKTIYTYAVLQEANDEESESWLYFIRYQGNEDTLQHLNKQLNQVRWRMEDGMSTFDLELDHLVCEKTAKEMTKIDLNHYSFHRKFDGQLKKIDLGFKETDKNSKKISRAMKVLGYGDIEKFIDKEDIDPEDLATHSEEESEDSESEETESSDSEEEKEKEKEKEKKTKKQGKVPEVVQRKIEIPRYAKAKIKHH